MRDILGYGSNERLFLSVFGITGSYSRREGEETEG